MTHAQYITVVHAELERLGMPALVEKYQPPPKATAILIARIMNAGYAEGVDPLGVASVIVESFKLVAGKVHPTQ